MIESQLATLLNHSQSPSNNRLNRIPRAELMATLRQYVFEQSLVREQTARFEEHSAQTDSDGEKLPFDFIEIKGKPKTIRLQDQVQMEHTNRLDFVKNVENLYYRKKRPRRPQDAARDPLALDRSGAVYDAQTEGADALDFNRFNQMIQELAE